MIFLFTYLKIGLWTTIYYLKPTDIIFEIIVNNIKKSGPVLTKLVQWVLPKIESLYDIKTRNKENEWFYLLEEVYENCGFHSLDYTFKKYEEDFHESFEKAYEKIEEIASGSIGQVYKITVKGGDTLAMKILHPNINYQINFFYCLFTIIRAIKPLHNFVNYYFPIDLHTFINDFKMQTDFINEANNNLQFSHMYRDNPYIIIPELRKVSKNIIIMSYEEGETHHKTELSDYLNYKTISLLKLFNKNNEAIYNFMHGDLHKGNWKLRINKSEVKLVIYDFGFCWSLPETISDNLVFINHIFMDIIINETSDKVSSVNINELAKVCGVFCEKKIPLDILEKEISKLIYEEHLSCTDSVFFIKVLLNCCRLVNVTINSYILSCIIGHNQMNDLYKMAVNDNFRDNDKDYNERYIYFKYFGDLINFCETNHIFLDYSDYLKTELEIEKIKRNIKFDELFLINEELENNEKIKALCIPPN